MYVVYFLTSRVPDLLLTFPERFPDNYIDSKFNVFKTFLGFLVLVLAHFARVAPDELMLQKETATTAVCELRHEVYLGSICFNSLTQL